MKKTKIGRGLIILLLTSVCIFSFNSSKRADTIGSTRQQLVNPKDMRPGGHYYFWDHGNGASVVQFDRMENGDIHTRHSITPQQALLEHDAVFTTYDAGDIQRATGLQIAHLHACVVAGQYIP